jgi:hypothetical protein
MYDSGDMVYIYLLTTAITVILLGTGIASLIDNFKTKYIRKGASDHLDSIVKHSRHRPTIIRYTKGWETYYIKVEHVDKKLIKVSKNSFGESYSLKESDD